MKNPCDSQCSKDNPESIAQALKIIGDKWTALILRWLHEEPQRFSDLRENIPEINPRTLTQRLCMLENNDIIEKKQFNAPNNCVRYTITQKGIDLDEVIHSMALWGEKYAGKA